METLGVLAAASLSALLGVALHCDLRTRRIPNSLVLTGMALGLLFQAGAPAGDGLLAAHHAGSRGLAFAALGAVVGLALLMPLHLLRALGAGDVKLFAMAGVWLGPVPIAHAALWTLLAGGALSVATALGAGRMRSVASTTRTQFGALLWRLPEASPAAPSGAGMRLPYAVAIAAGVGFEVIRQWSWHA